MDCCSRGSASPYPMLAIGDVAQIIEEQSMGRETEEVLVTNALGRILSTDVTSPCNVPAFPASMKDGYAVRAEEVEEGKVFDVVSVIMAGDGTASDRYPSNSVVKIMTGAAIPRAFDAVIMVEWSQRDGDRVSFALGGNEITEGHDVRSVGSDVREGELILSKGSVLQPAEIALLVSVGCTKVNVFRAPVVGVLSTGDELVDVAEHDEDNSGSLPYGRILDSNRPMLLSLLKAALPAVEVVDLGICSDVYEGLCKKLDAAFERVDVLISSGGVSMGDKDFMKKFVAENGTVHVGRVHMKPGKPLMFATLERDGRKKVVFATPGNPVSSMVGSLMFAVPGVKMMMGVDPRQARPSSIRVKMITRIRKDRHRPELHRAIARWDAEDNSFHATSTGAQASSRLLSLRSANVLVHIPMGEGTTEKGEALDAYVVGNLF